MTARSSCSSAPRTASTPRMRMISTMSFEVQRVGSIFLSAHITAIRLMPSVSSTHSCTLLDSPVIRSTPSRFTLRMKTRVTPSTPRSVSCESMLASNFLRNEKSSSSSPPSVTAASLLDTPSEMSRMRITSLSALSSLQMMCIRSAPYTASMRAVMSSIVSFLSDMTSLSSSMRSIHGEMRARSTSSSGIS